MNLRELRERRGLEQKELGSVIGVSQPTISAWETGQKPPSREKLKRLANFFDVTVDSLLGHDAPSEPPGENGIHGMYMRLAQEAQELELSAEDIKYMMSAYRRFKRANRPSQNEDRIP